MEYEDINMRCRKCLVACANGNRQHHFNRKCRNSSKGGKEGIKKISKTWFVRCKLQVRRVLIQNIDTLDYISICACKLTYLKKCIIPEKMKHLLSLSALAKEKGNPISMDKS